MKLIRLLFTMPLLLYQKLISPMLPGSCIYTPTCSAYSREAIMRHGVLKGSLLSVTRISRCAGGLFSGGYDPVPAHVSLSSIRSAYGRFRRKH